MESVIVCTEVVCPPRGQYTPVSQDYKLDLWAEARRRWLVFGVLLAVGLAAVAPGAGRPGGPLHPEYTTYPPLLYIYYSAGASFVRERSRATEHSQSVHKGSEDVRSSVWRRCAMAALHAHAVAPAMAAVTVTAFRDSGLDHRIVKGLLLSSACSPCGWLSLGLRGGAGGGGGAELAASWAAGLLVAPLVGIFVCGRGAVPHAGGAAAALLLAAAPAAAGAVRAAYGKPGQGDSPVPRRLCALYLVYCATSAALRDADAALRVGDVAGALALALSWLVICYLCVLCGVRCGLTRRRDAATVAAVALPKTYHGGWEWSTSCAMGGLSLLAAAVLTPAQALLLAAIEP